ncbi:hypothetical protein [Agromyces marinus]|nr:hypothetical protein [Agromyces marinus]
MRAVMLKEFQELRRDHRTLAMLIVLPSSCSSSSATPRTSRSRR